MTTGREPAKVRLSEGLGPLVDGEEDPARLWAEIHRLRAAVQGPDGYASWQDAATAERVQRVKLRNTLQGIAEADPRKWEELAEPIGEFARWAKSRAAHALTGGE